MELQRGWSYYVHQSVLGLMVVESAARYNSIVFECIVKEVSCCTALWRDYGEAY